MSKEKASANSVERPFRKTRIYTILRERELGIGVSA